MAINIECWRYGVCFTVMTNPKPTKAGEQRLIGMVGKDGLVFERRGPNPDDLLYALTETAVAQGWIEEEVLYG